MSNTILAQRPTAGRAAKSAPVKVPPGVPIMESTLSPATESAAQTVFPFIDKSASAEIAERDRELLEEDARRLAAQSSAAPQAVPVIVRPEIAEAELAEAGFSLDDLDACSGSRAAACWRRPPRIHRQGLRLPLDWPRAVWVPLSRQVLRHDLP